MTARYRARSRFLSRRNTAGAQYLIGPTGLGKTRVASAICYDAMMKEPAVSLLGFETRREAYKGAKRLQLDGLPTPTCPFFAPMKSYVMPGRKWARLVVLNNGHLPRWTARTNENTAFDSVSLMRGVVNRFSHCSDGGKVYSSPRRPPPFPGTPSQD